MSSRRRFMTHAGLMATAPLVSGVMQSACAGDDSQSNGRVLVVIQMDGGNDGLNTVIPYGQDEYHRRRPTLSIPKSRLIKINDSVGLHPSLRPAAELLEQECFSIVQGVGYPNPDRSHFRSMAIWHTADRGDHLPDYGWAGRALDKNPTGNTDMFFVGDEDLPLSLRGRRSIATSLSPGEALALNTSINPQRAISLPADDPSLQSFVQRSVLNAYEVVDKLSPPKRDLSSVIYPSTGLASRLKTIAGYIGAAQPAKLYYAIQPGYDTHQDQLGSHGELLSEFSGAVNSFMKDIHQRGLQDRVLVLAFSEFGRRVHENGSAGTDHGTAGPVFLAGAPLKRKLVGKAPNLNDLDGDDLNTQHDFRRIYSTVLEDWLQVPSVPALKQQYAKLPLFA